MQNIFLAIFGGTLISFSSVMMMISNSKIMGISGILSRSLTSPKSNKLELYFLAGVVYSGILYSSFFDVQMTQRTSLPLLFLAGILVGYGTKLGNGCTSGHGVCGLGRFSKRSFVSVIIFLVTGILTATIISLIK